MLSLGVAMEDSKYSLSFWRSGWSPCLALSNPSAYVERLLLADRDADTAALEPDGGCRGSAAGDSDRTATGAEPAPFAVMIALAASTGFLTPLEPACVMVYGPGRYCFVDFVKVGWRAHPAHLRDGDCDGALALVADQPVLARYLHRLPICLCDFLNRTG